MAITKYWNQVAQEKNVQQLIHGIQVQNNLTITLYKIKVKDNKLGNWLSAVSYLATKITETLESQRETRTKDVGAMLEGSQKLKVAD